jgi:8-oxo-dGTP pyrophosphatase MutT (NUDIX family)
MSQPKLAATVILCKPVRRVHPNYSDFKVLMVKRATKSRFAPGAHVFPGGVVESSDEDQKWTELMTANPSLSQITTPNRTRLTKNEVN